MNIQNDLVEREKELDCLYEIAALLARGTVDGEILLSGFAESLSKAMTYPEITKVNISSENSKYMYGPVPVHSSAFYATSFLDNGEMLKISIWYDPPE